MFGFITRTKHDRVVAELKRARDDALLAHKLSRVANDALRAKLAKVHTTRGLNGRFVKREEHQA